MRIALISTPRSGNTWLRLLLGDLFDLSHIAIHTPDDLDWSSLPKNCIVQQHWPKTHEFFDLLKCHKFRTVTIGRHPLDVLLSILNFAKHAPETALWLGGKGGNESLVISKSPTRKEFFQYSCSTCSRYLLGITADWWSDADVAVKYEDLVSNPEEQLARITDALDHPILRVRILKTIEIFTFKILQPTSTNQHYWKRSPGHWRRYIPIRAASEIYNHHRHIFEQLGYTISDAGGSLEECELR